MIIAPRKTSFPRRVANQVVVLERGAIAEEGPPEQIFDTPTVAGTHDLLGHLGSQG